MGRVAEALDVAEFAARNFADITFDGHFLFWLVHLAVVKNEPSELIVLAFFVPVAVVLPIIFGIFRQKSRVLAAFGNQHVLALFWRGFRKLQPQDTIVAGQVRLCLFDSLDRCRRAIGVKRLCLICTRPARAGKPFPNAS